jgi:hypothetical protein
VRVLMPARPVLPLSACPFCGAWDYNAEVRGCFQCYREGHRFTAENKQPELSVLDWLEFWAANHYTHAPRARADVQGPFLLEI